MHQPGRQSCKTAGRENQLPRQWIQNYLRPHSEYKISVQTLPSPPGCALDTQQRATHPPTGQYLGCVWVLALTLSPLGFKRPHWLEAGLRPASSEILAAMFLQIQLDLTGFAKTYPRAQNTQLNDKCPWTPSPPRCFGHMWLSYRSAPAWPSIMQDSRQRKSASQAMGFRII